jgi:pSer/pThr/pTyr-binding forkhead associated (FHA) protein
VTETLILTHMSGPDDGRVERLSAHGAPPEVTLGRAPLCTVCISHDPLVSRQHARVFRRDGAWWLEDLGSANGTFAGEFAQSLRVTDPVRLYPSHIFRLGQSRFRVEADESSAMLATAEAQVSGKIA